MQRELQLHNYNTINNLWCTWYTVQQRLFWVLTSHQIASILSLK